MESTGNGSKYKKKKKNDQKLQIDFFGFSFFLFFQGWNQREMVHFIRIKQNIMICMMFCLV